MGAGLTDALCAATNFLRLVRSAMYSRASLVSRRRSSLSKIALRTTRHTTRGRNVALPDQASDWAARKARTAGRYRKIFLRPSTPWFTARSAGVSGVPEGRAASATRMSAVWPASTWTWRTSVA